MKPNARGTRLRRRRHGSTRRLAHAPEIGRVFCPGECATNAGSGLEIARPPTGDGRGQQEGSVHLRLSGSRRISVRVKGSAVFGRARRGAAVLRSDGRAPGVDRVPFFDASARPCGLGRDSRRAPRNRFDG